MIIDSVHQNQNFPARILCVDDENHICQLLKAILFKAGYETFLAQSAKEGIAIARAEQVNLVLLDLKMPGISGYDACVALKSDPETSEIPIIMMSGLSDPEMRAKALDGGADEFITKPFDTTELLARVRSLVRIAKLRKSLLESNDELRSAYETARNAQEKYFSLVNDVLDSVFVVNTENGAIREANRAACSLLSIQKEDLIGRKFSDFCPEAPLIAADESLSIELRKTCGAQIPVQLKASFVQDSSEKLLQYTVRDLTPWRALEKQKIESERLAVIVETAIAVNEEVNSPLSVIMNNAETLRSRIQGLDNKSYSQIDLILEAARRIQTTASKLIRVQRHVTREYLPGAQMLDIETALSSTGE